MTACVTASSEAPVLVCPTLKSYPPELQARAARELEALPTDAALRIFMDDYAALRDQVRACRLKGPR